MNALEYQNLQDKLREPIRNAADIQVGLAWKGEAHGVEALCVCVQIYKTVSERFVEVFRREVASNPRADSPDGGELESCIGCMAQAANVVLVRRCAEDTANPCVNCYCRPMWCLDCMAKW